MSLSSLLLHTAASTSVYLSLSLSFCPSILVGYSPLSLIPDPEKETPPTPDSRVPISGPAADLFSKPASVAGRGTPGHHSQALSIWVAVLTDEIVIRLGSARA